MERDVRRDPGQWRGCYTFKDIICDGDAGIVPKRNGGLKMGQTYYYYYELDGAAETHDPAIPSTNACPYLPGQTVNTIWVPVEQSLRKRSASLNSLCEENYKTMNPADKYVTPRAAPAPPELPSTRRAGTAPVRLQHKRSARSLSPGSGWMFSPRKLFSRKTSSSSLRDLLRSPSPENERAPRSSAGIRSRDISPESLRRFLSDETVVEDEFQGNERPAIAIPEDIVEENEDDDNFATSAVSESVPFTGLSPPPSQRTASPSPPSTITSLGSGLLEAPTRPPPPPPTAHAPCPPTQEALQPLTLTVPGPQSPFSFSNTTFYLHSPTSPGSSSLPSFYDSEDEEDEVRSAPEDDSLPLSAVEPGPGSFGTTMIRNLNATLSTYSLPQSLVHEDKLGAVGQPSLATLGSPAIAAREGADLPTGNTSSFLNNPIPSSGLDDLLSELGWMANVIHGKAA
ncbi:hypothetical protein B0T22DRAFT_291307 [Podospora appendiculata]|uniref:Uncharacterized protein n=1 Tax=Podospora appendiculata TaxID=314037 RepID=A0AAE0X1H1_9PEZI|nr:hypothetical protein B0T22DRAFT_291307 [Podospora appendiculata]